MSIEAIEPLAVVTDYDGLVLALRRRVVELNTTLGAVDDLAGLPSNYTAKLLCLHTMKCLGPISLGPILGALGLKLALVVDEDALARVHDRLPLRKPGGFGLRDVGGDGRAVGSPGHPCCHLSTLQFEACPEADLSMGGSARAMRSSAVL
jgi:hypothetical protein